MDAVVLRNERMAEFVQRDTDEEQQNGDDAVDGAGQHAGRPTAVQKRAVGQDQQKRPVDADVDSVEAKQRE